MVKEALKNKFSIIGIILIACMVAFIFLNTHTASVPDVDIQVINKAVTEAAGIEDEPSENRLIKRYYGFNPNDYGEMIYYAPLDNMDAEELLLIKLNDEDDADTITDAITERLETQKKSFQGYGTTQTELLNNSRLVVKGPYILFVVDEESAKAADAFEKCF